MKTTTPYINSNGHSALHAKYAERTIKSKSDEISEYIDSLAKLYTYCYLRAKTLLAHESKATTTDCATLALSFFQIAIKHFDF